MKHRVLIEIWVWDDAEEDFSLEQTIDAAFRDQIDAGDIKSVTIIHTK